MLRAWRSPHPVVTPLVALAAVLLALPTAAGDEPDLSDSPLPVHRGIGGDFELTGTKLGALEPGQLRIAMMSEGEVRLSYGATLHADVLNPHGRVEINSSTFVGTLRARDVVVRGDSIVELDTSRADDTGHGTAESQKRQHLSDLIQRVGKTDESPDQCGSKDGLQ